MIEGNYLTFNMFDGELQYQINNLTNNLGFRLYISSYGFTSNYQLAIL